MIRSRSEVSQLVPAFGGEEMEGRPKLSFIMPAYNEGDRILEAVRRVDRVGRGMGIKYEVVVVDDGSADDTRRRLGKIANNNGRVRVIGYGRNMGKGYALKRGFMCTRGDSVVFLDSDLDIDVEQIGLYIRALEHGDVAVASKWHPDSKVEVPLLRKFLSRGFNVLVTVLTGTRLRDTQTGLKAVRREAVEGFFSRLAVKRYAFDAELLALCKLFGLKVVELPVRLRMTGRFSPREVGRMLIDLLGITYRLRVLKWYQRSTSVRAPASRSDHVER